MKCDDKAPIHRISWDIDLIWPSSFLNLKFPKSMDASPEIQAKRRFWLSLSVIIACIGAGFSVGYVVGREVEKQEWIELVNPPAENKPHSS